MTARILLLGPGLYLSGYEKLKPTLDRVKGLRFKVGTHEQITPRMDLVISFGYRRIIPPEFLSMPRLGTVIFHSSDLPRGRGWAPLYHALASGQRRHTVSMLFADAGIDTGPLIAKAHCRIDPAETLDSLRRKDDAMVAALLVRFLPRLLRGRSRGTPQRGRPTYHARRRPADSELDPRRTLASLLPKLRALDGRDYPAFVKAGGRTFELRLTPVEPDAKPGPIKITDYLR